MPQSYQDWNKAFQQQYGGGLGRLWNIGNLPDAAKIPLYAGQQAQNAITNPPTTPEYKPINFTDPTPYFADDKLKNFFALGRANALQTQEQAAAGAQRAARSQASSGNFLNPAMYSLNAGNTVRQAYSPVFGQLASQEAQALDANQKALLAALNQKSQFEEMARQFNVTDERQREALQQQLLNQYLQYQMQQAQFQNQRDLSGAGIFDYAGLLTSLLGLPLGAGVTLGGKIFG